MEKRLTEENVNIDPDKREWEYDGDGVKIYKEGTYNLKTVYEKKKS